MEDHLTKTGKEQSNSDWWNNRGDYEKSMMKILEEFEGSLGYAVFNLINLNIIF